MKRINFNELYRNWPDSGRKIFGEYLSYLQEQNSSNPKEFAYSDIDRQLGLSKSTVQRIIAGPKYSFRASTVNKLDELVTYLASQADCEVVDFETWLKRRAAPKPATTPFDLEAILRDQSKTIGNPTSPERSSNERAKWRLPILTAFTVCLLIAVALFSYAQLRSPISFTDADEIRIDRPVYAQDIAMALENADIKTLRDMSNYGVSVDRFELAFETSAGAYFAVSKDNPLAEIWFENLLKLGLDPETRTAHGKYTEVALFFSAFENGNVKAMKALLAHGASPHGYQKLTGTYEPNPFFLFPVHAVAKAEHLTEEDKITLIENMFEKGVAFYDPEIVSPFTTNSNSRNRTWFGHRDALENIFRLSDQRPQSPEAGCKFSRSKSLCSAHSEATGQDWCKVIQEIPVSAFVEDRYFQSHLAGLAIQDLISISDGKTYFFLTHVYGQQSTYGLVEASTDGNILNVFTYGSPFRRGHVCQGDEDFRAMSACWRDATIQKTSETTGTLSGTDVRLALSCN